MFKRRAKASPDGKQLLIGLLILAQFLACAHAAGKVFQNADRSVISCYPDILSQLEDEMMGKDYS